MKLYEYWTLGKDIYSASHYIVLYPVSGVKLFLNGKIKKKIYMIN